jgi:LAO/AO transport system kinase
MEVNAFNIHEKIINRDRIALSRIITYIENEDPRAIPILKGIYKNPGKSYRIGITGPPGAGKSTLVDSLTTQLRKKNKSVGIIAVDPTSPFTGGALLGDRIRMSSSLKDKDVFMRSMASRGATGGLARTTNLAVDILEAFNFDIILVETVGVGQLELDIAQSVDTTLVVLVPETCGNVQALKAGIVEIADIFVINKADRSGADILEQELLESLDLKIQTPDSWRVPVVKTCALDGTGVAGLVDIIGEHYNYLQKHNILLDNRLKQKQIKIVNIIKQHLENQLWNNAELIPLLKQLSMKCENGEIDPYTAADMFLSSACISHSHLGLGN